MKESFKGAVWVFLAAACFSISGVCIKMIPWGALAINGGRSVLSLLVVGLYLKCKGRRVIVNKGTLLGAACLCATCTMFVMANKLTTAANAIVLQYTTPVFVVLYLWAFFGRRPGKLDVGACVAVLLGIGCFFVDSLSSGGMAGNLLAIASGATFAVMFLFNQMPGGDSFSSIILGQVMSAGIGLPFLFTQATVSPRAITGILILGVFQMGLAYIFFAKGIETTPPLTASLVSSIEPILNPIWVALIYGETMGHTALVGAIIVLGSIFGYNILKSRHPVTE